MKILAQKTLYRHGQHVSGGLSWRWPCAYPGQHYSYFRPHGSHSGGRLSQACPTMQPDAYKSCTRLSRQPQAKRPK